ncbi:MAG: flagellar biosynthesis protein FlgE [Sphingomonadales bacterium 32-68-7]|nr:MAG: flagellar biosynthesis protein FlgE [Sphingomonadales bacterium 32-68-7]
MSFYTSLNGMKNAQTDLSVIAHNIANVETNGFKRSRTEFADVVVGSALDIAVNGDGFFTTRSTTGQTLYTRNGSFGLDENGYVTDNAYNRLQGYAVDASGVPTSTTPADLQIPATNAGAEFASVTVAGDGNLIASYDDGSTIIVGKVALASFVSPNGLKQVGSSNWQATGLSGPANYGNPGEGRYGDLMSGGIERSNVDIAEELVSLITAQRNFQANAKAIDAATQISQAVINLRT